jgi:hypothetical protein
MNVKKLMPKEKFDFQYLEEYDRFYAGKAGYVPFADRVIKFVEHFKCKFVCGFNGGDGVLAHGSCDFLKKGTTIKVRFVEIPKLIARKSDRFLNKKHLQEGSNRVFSEKDIQMSNKWFVEAQELAILTGATYVGNAYNRKSTAQNAQYAKYLHPNLKQPKLVRFRDLNDRISAFKEEQFNIFTADSKHNKIINGVLSKDGMVYQGIPRVERKPFDPATAQK